MTLYRTFCKMGLSILTLLFTAAHVIAAPLPGTVPPPVVLAQGYVLMDFHTGQVLAESRSAERMEPASLTKLMTAYVLFKELKAGHIHLSDEVVISERAWRMEGSRTFIRVGSKVPLEVLLKGMIIQSGNDATVALAEHAAGDEEVFVALMNEQAKALGLSSSHFVNSTGLPDPQHYTTAHDLAVLARAIIQEFPDYYAWYSIRDFTYNKITQHNRNLLLWRDEHVDGMKTGHTESAGYCLVASALHGEMRLISVVLGTASEDARASESSKLLNYGFQFFETHRLYQPGQPLSTVRIWKGETDNLPLGLTQEIYIALPRGQYGNLKAEVKAPQPIMAPARKGAQFGALTIRLADQVLVTRPLVSLQAVAEGNLFRRTTDAVRLWLK